MQMSSRDNFMRFMIKAHGRKEASIVRPAGRCTTGVALAKMSDFRKILEGLRKVPTGLAIDNQPAFHMRLASVSTDAA